jgi:hypothetical protein
MKMKSNQVEIKNFMQIWIFLWVKVVNTEKIESQVKNDEVDLMEFSVNVGEEVGLNSAWAIAIFFSLFFVFQNFSSLPFYSNFDIYWISWKEW